MASCCPKLTTLKAARLQSIPDFTAVLRALPELAILNISECPQIPATPRFFRRLPVDFPNVILD
jgi:hypothetical protein